jgi:hypothetical protein
MQELMEFLFIGIGWFIKVIEMIINFLDEQTHYLANMYPINIIHTISTSMKVISNVHNVELDT